MSQSTAEILLLPVSEKTNGRHIETMLPVSILTFSLSSACGFPSAYQISSKSDHPRQSYDVMAIFKMAAVSQVMEFLGDNQLIRDSQHGFRKINLYKYNNAIFE